MARAKKQTANIVAYTMVVGRKNYFQPTFDLSPHKETALAFVHETAATDLIGTFPIFTNRKFEFETITPVATKPKTRAKTKSNA